MNFNFPLPLLGTLLGLLLCSPIYAQISVATDSPFANYIAGQSMSFEVSSSTAGPVYYEIRQNRGNNISTIDIPALTSGTLNFAAAGTINIPFSLPVPGTVFCFIDDDTNLSDDQTDPTERKWVGAVFSPLDIQQTLADPADFQSFWAGQKALLPALDPVFTAHPTTNTERINIGIIDGRRVYGYISYPAGASQTPGGGPYPVVLTLAPNGNGPNTCNPQADIAADFGAISVSIWAHDGEPDVEYTPGYNPNNLEDRNENYYRYPILGAIQVLNYLEDRGDIQMNQIAVRGVSEGGGLAMLVGGIDERVDIVMASNGALAAHDGWAASPQIGSGFSWWGWQAANQGLNVNTVLNETKYFDAARAMSFFKGKFSLLIGYRDDIVHPSTNFTAYNRHEGQNVLLRRPLLAHSHGGFEQEFTRLLKRCFGTYDFTYELGNIAEAGPDQIITGALTANLTAIIQEQGLTTTTWPITWELIDGPGSVAFDNANSYTPMATFSASGTYRIRLTAQNDLEGNGFHTGEMTYTLRDYVEITINNSPCAPDVIAPVAICQDITATLDNSGNAVLNPLAINDGSTDDCSAVESLQYSVSPSVLGCADVETTIVTLTVTDEGLNEATCTATVNLEDLELPQIQNCPENSSIVVGFGNCQAVVNWTEPTASDNCGTPTLTADQSNNILYPVGIITVNYTATDASGNMETCSFVVTIEDQQLPILGTCPNNISVDSDMDQCGAYVSVGMPTASDNCPGIIMSNDFNNMNDASGDYPVGTTTVIWTIMDASGNLTNTNCTTMITVNDNEDPTITCEPSLTITLDANGQAAAVTLAELNLVVADNCEIGVGSPFISGGAGIYQCSEVGQTGLEVQSVVFDENGNNAACTTAIIVVDNIDPVANCQNISVMLDATTATASITGVDLDNGSTDACSLTFSASPNSFTCADLGQQDLTLTVTDAGGNTATCISVVTVSAPDSDGDTYTICEDCNDNDINIFAGATCDDLDDCTTNDIYDANCNCAGTFADSDNDTVCDADDICNGFDDLADADNDGTPDACDTCDGTLAGTSCDDLDDCTTNDIYDANCNCAGTFADSDNDTVCDADDICNGFDDLADADNDGTPDACDTCDGTLAGTSCDDLDDCTTNDIYDANCNCAGTFADSDNDTVCDADDICNGFDDLADADNDGTPDACDTCDGTLAGTSCDDLDDCTTNDIYDANCNCAGTFADSDNDTVCDADDICNGFDDLADADNDGTPDACDTCDGTLAGTSCDDLDDCTTNDIYDANCNCAGTFADSDNDTVCDADDICNGFDDLADADNDGTPDACDTCDGTLAGTSCDDLDDCTTNDIYDANCNCAGTFADSDNDTVCDADDICNGFDDLADADNDGTPDACDTCDGTLAGTSCDDLDDCTTNDIYDANCNCAGTFADSDNDTVCDADDICNGFDDLADADNDGTPDACDTCDGTLAGTSCDDLDDCTTNDIYDANCNCAGTFADSDNDTVCDADDICNGFDDLADADNDGTPDACDTCDGTLAGTSCDDLDDCTTNDIYDANCNCAGTFADSDNDTVCDADDICNGFDDLADADNDGTPDACDTCDGTLAGTSCDDLDDCTTNDIYDANCNCAGTFADSDNDTVCDADDICNGFDDLADADNDGTPDACDTCDGTLAGTSCDDLDDCTTNDIYDANCNCAGTFADSDNDTVCDADDICNGFDDLADADNDGTPDACDTCDGTLAGTSCDDLDDCTTNDIYDANCNCAGTFADSDNDTVCDADDICNGFDDLADADNDGTPDACDTCDGTLAGTSCDDGDPCTTGETFDANCNCIGGTLTDADNDGYALCDGDCDDSDPNVNPGMAEISCNGIDDDCDANTSDLTITSLVVQPFDACTPTSSAGLNPANTGIVPSCVTPFIIGYDHWFSFVVPVGGEVIIQTFGGDTFVGVLTNTCDGSSVINCNDDNTETGINARLELSGLTPGMTLYAVVWNVGFTNTNDINICISLPEPCVEVTCYTDNDMDDFGAGASQVFCTSCPTGFADNADDCNDSDPNINPGMSEIPCNEIDDDCNAVTTDGTDILCFADFDDDGFGDPNNTVNACNVCPPNYIENNPTDCNDSDPNINPGMSEIPCNEIDDDCNAVTTDGTDILCFADFDDDGFGDPNNTVNACNTCPPNYIENNFTDCNDGDANVNPNMSEIPCNGIDDDCNPATPDVPAVGCGGDCTPATKAFSTNPLTHIGPQASTAFATFGNGDKDIAFTISDMGYKTSGPMNGRYIDYVTVTYEDLSGNIITYGSYYGNQISTVNVFIAGEITLVTLAFGDIYDGNAGSMISIDLTDIDYCLGCVDSDQDGLCDADDVCPNFDDNLNGTPCDDGDACTINDYYVDCNCVGTFEDTDNDGVCNVDDCNPYDPTVYSGAPELCDNVDNNCDGYIDEGLNQTWYFDNDGDTFGDPSTAVQACSQPSPFHVLDGTDCNDDPNNWGADTHPGAPEFCDGMDNNCDGIVDEGFAQITYYFDADYDGYGDPNNTIQSCYMPVGYVADGTDCDDTQSNVHPGGYEFCDGQDNDCDGYIDEENGDTPFYSDNDEDGFGGYYVGNYCVGYNPPLTVGNDGDCNDWDATINPNAMDDCDGIDNNCNGQVDEDGALTSYYSDWDGDGYGAYYIGEFCTPPAYSALTSDDCNDWNSGINPGVAEICNFFDDNCNGQIDEGVMITFYWDGDGDNYGNSDIPIEHCYGQANFAPQGGDCVDYDPTINPGAVEYCNGIDDNCDGQIDENCITPLIVQESGIIAFDAQPTELGADLYWVTKLPMRNDYFIVEKSMDGENFVPAFEVDGLSESETPRVYRDLDEALLEGATFYRVKQIHLDGTHIYSDIRRVDFLGVDNYMLFPNPTEKEIFLNIKGLEGLQAEVRIVNQYGQIISTQAIEMLEDRPFRFDLNNYRDGLYMMWIKAEGQRAIAKRFVIANMD